MKNIVQLYFDNDKQLPFIVRRESWSDSFALLIVSVKPRKTSNGCDQRLAILSAGDS